MHYKISIPTNLRSPQTLLNVSLQERIKITSSWHILERRLDFHVEIFFFLLASLFFLLTLHYKNLSVCYHPHRLLAKGPVHCFNSCKQWSLNNKLAMHQDVHGYQKPLGCQGELWRLLLLPSSCLCNAIIQPVTSLRVECGYKGFSAFLTAVIFCYDCFISAAYQLTSEKLY